MSESNPFDELHPVVRNEEDEIRKGVFSFTLRKLHGLTFEEKLEWCAAIRDSTAPKQPKVKQHSAKAAPPAPAATVAPAPTTAVVEGSHSAQSAQKRQRSPSADATLSPPAKFERTEVPTTLTAASVKDLPITTEEASEYISAYMRTLLDKVVGGSLNDLAVPALRVLCQMVGIATMARSKDALYSMLASFHFTSCAKLGKRVSKQTFIEQEAKHTAEMMRTVAPTSRATAAKKPPAEAKHARPPAKGVTEPDGAAAKATGAATATATAATERPTGKGKRGEALQSAVRGTQPTAARAPARGGIGSPGGAFHPSYSDSDADYEDDDSDAEEGDRAGGELNVALPKRAFRAPQASAPFSTSTSLSAGNDAEWSAQDIDRRVASIVQLYDPVTVAIVVKKLSQMGYKDPNAAQVVENTLRRFHVMQLLFYDNGIAYML